MTPESEVITSEGTSASSFPFNFIGGFPKQFLLGQISNCGGMPEERKSVSENKGPTWDQWRICFAIVRTKDLRRIERCNEIGHDTW